VSSVRSLLRNGIYDSGFAVAAHGGAGREEGESVVEKVVENEWRSRGKEKHTTTD
jgi:hypothetical protein